MSEFDEWRTKYEKMSYEEQVAYHNDLEKRFPDQAHFTYPNVVEAIKLAKPYPIVLEFGSWKGDLAQRIMTDHLVQSWTGIEICDDAMTNTHCNNPSFHYDKPERFDWFAEERKYNPDIIIATHFIEHLSAAHFMQLTDYCKGVDIIYFEAPLSQDGQNWAGYHGTHKLEYGWKQVVALMGINGYKVEKDFPEGKIFKYEV